MVAIRTVHAADFEDFRRISRALMAENIPPERVIWQDARVAQDELFAPQPPVADAAPFGVPARFVALARHVSAHRDPRRFGLLYGALWRIRHGEKHLLELATDPLVHALKQMEKSVTRDMHKTKAFVRFRRVEEEGHEHFVAWHRPDHRVLSLVAPFFARRFTAMRWAILTPDESVSWDGGQLHFGPGMEAKDAPQGDALESLWRSYYRATFNPARVNMRAMKREMPVRHWPTLPEAQLIAELLAEAPARAANMIARQEGLSTSAADFLPEAHDLESLREAAAACEGCPLYRNATQTVFGEGARHARLMLVGEQPGDREDRAGNPFIGPAGEVLARAMEEAGVGRGEVYLTNAVKHFKFARVGEERQHRSPDIREITACKPWLEAEIDAIRPRVILCLGATAAKSLLGFGFTLKTGRGRIHPYGDSMVAATYHPSAVLRAREEGQQKAIYDAIVEDLRRARALAQR